MTHDRIEPVGSDPASETPQDRGATPSAGVGELRPRFRDLGREAVDAARDQILSGLSDQQRRAAEQLDDLAGALRHGAGHLDARHNAAVARYIKTLADWLDGLASGLRERDSGQLMDETKRFARRQPTLWVGGAVAAGVLVSRFIKSSAVRRNSGRGPGDPDVESLAAGAGAKTAQDARKDVNEGEIFHDAVPGTEVEVPGGPASGALRTTGEPDQ
jgi:hypothetical protein